MQNKKLAVVKDTASKEKRDEVIGKNFPEFLTIYLPENLDLNKLIEENPPTGFTAFDKDKIAYILHLINYLPTIKKDFDYYEYDGYIPINKQKLQSKIYDYRMYLDYLIHCGVIFEDEYYIKGEKSKGICFYPEYTYTKIRRSKITRKTLIKAILKGSSKHNLIAQTETEVQTENKTGNQDEFHYLTKWWKSNGLTIDYEAAKNFLDEKLLKDREQFIQKFGTDDYETVKKQFREKGRKKAKEKVKYPLEQYNSALMTMDRLYRKDYFIRVDETAGRLHSLLSQLPKDLRQFVSFESKKLVSIDLRNSQPLLATVLLNTDLFKSNPILINTISKFNPIYQQTNSSTMIVDLIKKNQDKPDVLNYKRIVAKGEYYEEFGTILQTKGFIPDDCIDSRKFAKEATYASFFAPNTYLGFTEPMKHFKKAFPNVYHIFSRIKFQKKGYKGRFHKALAITLQAFEADLFLHKICKRIYETNPDIPIFTIHDSVVTTIEYTEIVEQILKEEVFKAIGVNPILNIEKW